MDSAERFPFKTKPFRHQLEEFARSRDSEHWGLFWEMGCAKTKVTLDTAAHLWNAGKIDGLLILAPEGVNAQWLDDEIPTHLPDWVTVQKFLWLTSKSAGVKFNEAWAEFISKPLHGLKVLAMTYDSLMTERGAWAARKFLEARRCLLVADESTRIKTPGTKVTKRVLAMSKWAPYRRLLNGTPIADSPFNAYTQIRFLNADAWRHLGIGDSTGFRTYFGQFIRRFNGDRQNHYDQLVGYKNLEDLANVFRAHGSRLLKSDVFPDLPPKLYSKHYFELTPAQRRAYTDLKEQLMTSLGGGAMVTADQAIVRLTRFQQVCSGYLPADDEEQLTPLVEPNSNPRIKLLIEVLEEVPGKVIIWAKYDIDVDLIANAVHSALGWDTVTWDGRTKEKDRQTAKARFLDPTGARAFIGKASSSAARGLNLQVADTVVYYNNGFVLDDRLQSEDRAHRPGIHHAVKYIDLVAKGTIDEHILKSLRTKRSVASVVTGDEITDWV